jgi:YcxB-like protein
MQGTSLIRITYRISEDDYMDAYDLYVAHEPWYRRVSRQVMPWLGALIIALQVAALVLGEKDIPPLTITFIAVGLYLLYCGFALRLHFKKLYQNDRRLQFGRTAEISEDGIHVVTPDSDSRMKWSSFVRILESDRVFVLFLARWSFGVVPKSAFATGEVDSFRELAHQKIAVHT